MTIRDRHGYEIPFYDESPYSDGKLYIHCDSMGITGIVRATSWEDAYSVCEDEFFPEAGETVEELVKEYGFERKHVRDGHGWKTVETPSPDAWIENELFCEAYGFRPNGPNVRDKVGHGIYSKDLNGDSLDLLTLEVAAHLELSEVDIPDIDAE